MVYLLNDFSAFIFHSNVHLLSSTFWHMLIIYTYVCKLCCLLGDIFMVDFRFCLFICMLMCCCFFVMSCFNGAMSLIRLENTAL